MIPVIRRAFPYDNEVEWKSRYILQTRSAEQLVVPKSKVHHGFRSLVSVAGSDAVHAPAAAVVASTRASSSVALGRAARTALLPTPLGALPCKVCLRQLRRSRPSRILIAGERVEE